MSIYDKVPVKELLYKICKLCLFKQVYVQKVLMSNVFAVLRTMPYLHCCYLMLFYE